MPVVNAALRCIEPDTLTTFDWERSACFAPHLSAEAIGAAQWPLLNVLDGDVVLEAGYRLQTHIERIRAPGIDVLACGDVEGSLPTGTDGPKRKHRKRMGN